MSPHGFRIAAVLTLSVLLGTSPAAEAEGSSLADLTFLSGCWQGKLADGAGTIEERYNPPAAGLMLGTSHIVADGNTRFFEFIQIEQSGDEVLLTPMPRGAKSVPFKLVRLERKQAIFENREHDLPRRIIYRLTDDGSLVARAEGDKPGQAEEFRLQPIECSGTNIAIFDLKWGEPGEGTGQYDNPSGIALFKDPFGVTTIVFADTNNHRLREFTGTGMFIEKWGRSGSDPGEFRYPQGVAVNRHGEIVIADAGNHRIQVTSGAPEELAQSAGVFRRAFGKQGGGDGEFDNPLGVAVDAEDNIYVADTNNHRVQKFDARGLFLAKWGGKGSGPGEFDLPMGIAVDSRGDVYVVDTDNHRVQKFDAAGRFLLQWGGGGSRPGQFYRPKGIAVAATGEVYVADCNNHRVQKFSPAGKFMGSFGVNGTADGELSFPSGVAVDGGSIFVTDSGNHRIQVFRENAAVARLYGAR